MNKLFFLFVSVSIVFVSCGQTTHTGKHEKDTPKIEITADRLDVKLDPVCRMSMEKTAIVDTMTYKGKLYGFCNPGCKDEFKAEPEKFLSQLPQE